jgi:hypothetical protein
MSPIAPTDTATRTASNSRNKRSSTARTLVHAAALAAVLVPLGTVAVETTSITCGFGTYGVGSGGCSASGAARTFDFGPYDLTLRFDNLVNAEITVEDFLTTQEELTGEGGGIEVAVNRLATFPNHICVPIAGFDDCVEFEVTAPTGLGFYNVFIHWDADTNGSFPNDPFNRIRMLHAIGDDTYDTDITVLGTYDPDPGIGGRDNNFQRLLVTQTPPIPEPGTMLLIGSGLASLLYHRRRRSRDAGRKPNA